MSQIITLMLCSSHPQSHDPASGIAGQTSEQHTTQHIGRVMHIQIQPGKRNQERQHQNRFPQFLCRCLALRYCSIPAVRMKKQRRCRCERSGCVPGRKGPARWSWNQKLNGRVHITGARPGYTRFDNSVTQNGIYEQRRRKHCTAASRFRDQQ